MIDKDSCRIQKHIDEFAENLGGMVDAVVVMASCHGYEKPGVTMRWITTTGNQHACAGLAFQVAEMFKAKNREVAERTLEDCEENDEETD